MATPRSTGKKAKLHQRTIAEELLKKWKELYRKGDADELSKLLKVSKPTIDKALIYGCVHQQMIVDGINTYFAQRLMGERTAASNLDKLQAAS